jgi:hypothetical protein
MLDVVDLGIHRHDLNKQDGRDRRVKVTLRIS